MESINVREQLVTALDLDLVGPSVESALEQEVLPQSPSRWYLTGFLVPLEAGEAQRTEETGDEGIDEQLEDATGSDDADVPEPAAAKRAFFPSSMGLSILLSGESSHVQVTASWGDYRREVRENGSAEAEGSESAKARAVWLRTARRHRLDLEVPARTAEPIRTTLPDSGGVEIVLVARPVPESAGGGTIPDGTRTVSVFLVNGRRPAPDEVRDEAFVFQAELGVRVEAGISPRPDLRGESTADPDERIADLQYRDVLEHAVGHGVATQARTDPDGVCREVRTCWLPREQVERVEPAPMDGVELGMEALADLEDGAAASTRLGPMVKDYRDWIASQRDVLEGLSTRRRETADHLLARAAVAADRIQRGIRLLGEDPQVLEAFRIANRAMAMAARRRFGTMEGRDPSEITPRWRPFQLAFLLMNLKGIAREVPQDGEADERELVDLLFFPTGGGKTEAYFGLAAFTLVLRRLRNPGLQSAGVSVLMRYTLRLLTLDQLGRAATLICALELLREKDDRLGPWPFEIGLWVGRAATPNRMGAKGDKDDKCAYRKTIAFLNDDRKPSPIPLEECPWCGEKFRKNSFRLVPEPAQPLDLRVQCASRDCDFTRGRALPIVAVDEPIYRRLPCFVIATVDKFAAMPWTGQVGGLFGKVDRADQDGFYGPADPGGGQPLERPLLPPDLVIQDELHLISGPLGTMAGLYETALDALCRREIGGKRVRPKIIASTATVRRADPQIRAVFERTQVDVFPPPGPDVRDSFFARTRPPEEVPARLYIGVAAQGRAMKRILLHTYLALLGAAQRAWRIAGGKRTKPNPADPYMTLLGYFNSLRELGGSRRIVEDEVRTRLARYGDRRREGEPEGLFDHRDIAFEPVELTSRVSTAKVAEAKRLLAQPHWEKDHVDVAIATNMIAVGLDITRLGLMVVLGQPKTNSEYIQATSRVGRDPARPGLVVNLLNIHRPRDRSHYERFSAYHRGFYRTVEATSVTPFSPRALDRGLAGTAVALSRLGTPEFTPPRGAEQILQRRPDLDPVVDEIARRAAAHATLEAADAEALRLRVRDRVVDLLNTWSKIADSHHGQGVALQYQREIGGARPLLHQFMDADLKSLPSDFRKFRANRSLRDVEPSVNLWVRTLDGIELEGES